MLLVSRMPAWAGDADKVLDQRLALLKTANGAPTSVIAAAENLADAYAARGNFKGAAAAISHAAFVATSTQSLETVIRLGIRQIALCRSAKDQDCEKAALINQAVSDAEAGRADMALSRLQAVEAICRREGDWAGVLVARFNAAGARFNMGDTDGALHDLRNIENAIRQQEPALADHFDLSLAEVLIAAGQPGDALAATRRALQAFAARPAGDSQYYMSADPRATAESLTGRALARLRRGDEAVAAFSRATAASHSSYDQFFTRLAMAEGLLDLGRTADAMAGIALLNPMAKRQGEVAERDFHKLAARIYAAAGHADLALPHALAAADLQAKFYRDSLAEAVAGTDTAIALVEREATAEQMQKQNLAQQSAALDALARLRLAALLTVAAILLGGVVVVAVIRWRARRQREAEIAAERTRIAAEIHDTLLQGFIGVAMQVRAAVHAAQTAHQANLAGRLERIAAQATASLVEARRAMTNSASRALPPAGGLAGLTAGWLKRLQPDGGARLSFIADPDLPQLADERTTELHYVVREAVTNALRHGECSEIQVALRACETGLVATVRDNGRGFDPAACAAAPSDNWGLRLMRERMARIGGALQIATAPGAGTVVTATLPG